MLHGLAELVELAENAPAIDDASELRRRLALLDRLDAYSIDSSSASHAVDALGARARRAQAALEAANQRVFDIIRDDIRRGDLPSALLRWAPGPDQADHALDAHEGYDHLDDIVAGVLRIDEPELTTVVPTAEMVFYQPTPARHLFDLFQRVPLSGDDVLMDLGAGLGQVAMLTTICTPARAIGVEIEPAYVACAQGAAASLRLDRATFVEADAREADIRRGTVFFLYTPFGGQMLGDMLALLAHEARRRVISVCTFGPCTAAVAAQPWLVSDRSTSPHRVAVFRSRRAPQ